MENYIYVKPALKKIRGAKEATPLKVRDPSNGNHMPAYGAKVLDVTAIRRMLLEAKPNACRIQRGPDLVKITEAEFKSGKAGAEGAKTEAKALDSAFAEKAPEQAPSKKPSKADK